MVAELREPDEKRALKGTRYALQRSPWRLDAVARRKLDELAQVLGLSVSATSSQLQMLRRAGLIKFRKSGKLAFYSLRRPELLELITEARELAAAGER